MNRKELSSTIIKLRNEGLIMPEIAAKLGVSLGVVNGIVYRVRIRDALKRLKTADAEQPRVETVKEEKKRKTRAEVFLDLVATGMSPPEACQLSGISLGYADLLIKKAKHTGDVRVGGLVVNDKSYRGKRDAEIISACAAGEPIDDIKERFGLTSVSIRRIVALGGRSGDKRLSPERLAYARAKWKLEKLADKIKD